MHTLETVIVIPTVLIFILLSVCVNLKYAEVISKHAEFLKISASEETTKNADVLRGGMIINELYEDYLS